MTKKVLVHLLLLVYALSFKLVGRLFENGVSAQEKVGIQ